MGKKSKKGGLIGDFSDEEEQQEVVEETPKKGKKAKEESDEEVEKPTKKENGKKKGAKSKDVEEEEEKPSKTAGKKKAKVEEDEEEESKPAKKSKAKKAAKAKAEPESEEEQEEEDPKKKKQNGDKKSKKKKGGNWQDYDEEDAEEDAKPTKKATKATDEEKSKAKKSTAKKSAADEDDNEDEVVEAPKKGKTKAKKAAKAKQADEEEEEEGEEEPKGKGKQATKAEAPVAAPKKKGKKKAADDYWDQEFEKDAEAATNPTKADAEEETGGEKTDKKKKKKKAKAKSEDATEPAAKETPAKSETKPTKQPEKPKDTKADAKNKKMAKALELLRKQREEQEKIEREAEEIRKQQEEEERLMEEEELRLEEEERKIREAKKKGKSNKPVVSAAVQMRNKQDEAFLQTLREQGKLPKDATAKPEKVRSKVYQPKRNKQNKKTEEETSATEVAPVTETPQTQPEPAKPDAAEEEDDWENWEDHVDDVIKKIEDTKLAEEEPKESTPTPAPTPAPAPTQTPAPAATPAQKPKETKAASKKEKKATSKKGKKEAEGEVAEEEKPEGEDEERELRSPICCILGHVDTGKTSLLDKIRHTDVQKGEAGGITQQIGATYFPMAAIQEKTQALSEKFKLQMKVPGLLVIDTPGHESFTNLRSRGSGLCDIAILVVDIMHALEPQTIESINLLRMRKTPFVVALNKVDRIYGWRSKPFNPFRDSLKIQDKSAAMEFEHRTNETINAFAEQGLNACLYYRNTDFRKYVSLVPTSAFTGEGIPDLLMLLVQLTQKMMPERLYFSDEVQCTVLEVKVVEGLGTTLDVILVNGVLREGDTIVLCGLNGPIVTTIRAVLAPQPLRELRVKGAYEKLKEIKAAMGTKIVAQDLEKAVAGSALYVAHTPEDIEDLKEEVQSDFDSILNSVDSSSRGVCVQASTLGSLEALLTFLKSSKIPVSGVSIGPIHKRDVIRASVMLEHNAEFAVILAFDVKVEKDAQALADSMGVKIFTADIIYHLFDRFTAYMDDLKKKKREAAGDQVVWPCIARIKPEFIFNKKGPIVVGMEIISGTLRLGTPLCVTGKTFVDIGVVTGIEKNHKQQQEAKKGDEVAIKIESSPENAKEYGKHFDHQPDVCSKISRESIDLLVSLWGEELSQSDRQLIMKLKGVFKIQ